MKISQVKNVKKKKGEKNKNYRWDEAHLKNVLGSLGGNGCGSGLLLLNSTSWTGELGMGSKRVGCPLPTPQDSRALRLGTLTNLFVGDLSFFFFCCVKNNTCENTHLRHKNQQDNRKIEIWHGKFFGTFVSNCHVKINQCYPKCGLVILESVRLYGILKDRHAARTESTGQGPCRSGSPLPWPLHGPGKEQNRTESGVQGTSEVGEVPNTTGVTGFRLKSEGIKLNIILKERLMNFIHLSKGGCSCLEKKKE